MPDQHIVYAVLDTVGMPKIPVSRPLSWNEAQDRWYALDNIRTGLGGAQQRILTVGQPRDHYPDVPVRYLVVRSADDPQWPAELSMSKRMRGLVRGALGRWA